MTTSNRDKLAAISYGDIVSYVWMIGTRRETRTGIVAGWHFDKYGRHNLQIDHGGQGKETPVLLSSVVSRRRVAGADKGKVVWHHEQEPATIGV